MLQQTKDDAKALRRRAYCYLKLADRSRELEAPEKIVKDQRTKALADANRLVARTPEDADAWALRGEIRSRDDATLSEATDDYAEAARLAPRDDEY